MLLHDLLRSLHSPPDLDGLPNTRVAGVKEDSRLVNPGDLFVARAGSHTDGQYFLADAHVRGAIAAVVPARTPAAGLPQVVVADTAGAASHLAHALFGDPSRSVRVVGVTGTNGKTTTVYLLRHLVRKFGRRCGMIGTVQVDDGRNLTEASMTTPCATDVAALMAQMRDNGCAACCMEVSSHALDQHRVSGVHFAGAAFTNLTGDHLDYHRTMEHYAAAKAHLFEMLAPSATAVLNARDPWSARIARDCKSRIVRFGFDDDGGDGCDYQAANVRIASHGSRFELHSRGAVVPVSMSLIGRHNVENALAAAALAAEAYGMSLSDIAAGLADAAGAPGRLQAVRCGQGFAVLVDYAHTDDALTNVLTALRPLTQNKLRVVFGCGGDRDRTKRPRMAAVAEKLADAVYVTSDNPRTEMPLAIIADIVAGFSEGFSARAIVEPDRRCAIERILAGAQAGDVVLIAGKGHEDYQIIGAAKHHFDDAEEAARVLEARKHAA